MARLSSVNLLQTAAGGRRLWQLSAGGDRFTVQSEKALLLNERVPAGIAGKDWQTLFRGKLNLAWLPANKVFLRAVQLPPSEPAEMLQMIELQLEKLSPLPVTQIVWSAYLLPRPPENQEALQTLAFCETLEPLPPPTDKPKEALQTAIVMLASRSAVEEFLGQLEADGYLADRLEAPGLDQLLAADIRQDGVWIFPGGEDDPVLVAWRYGGTVQYLTIVFLPAGPERGPRLKTQIEQMAWAGELEGWLSSPPKIHLVGGPAEANFWEPVFKEAGEQIEVVAPTPARELVALSAQRCAGKAAGASLLPPEFATRYRQQFVDGLWMRGLMALLSAYVIGVLIYFGALYVLKIKYTRVKQQLDGISQSYTNSLKDAAQLEILIERSELKYKALDCWKALAVNMPDDLTLEGMYFTRAVFQLHGTASDPNSVLSFNQAMRDVVNPNREGQPLFADVTQPTMVTRNSITEWRFNCTMKQEGNE